MSLSMSTTTPPTHIPIRAISSTILRSSPPLPSASHSYEPLVKALFGHRLKFALGWSALAVSLAVTSWTIWEQGGISEIGVWSAISTPLTPWTVLITGLTWLSVALPVMVLQKIFLTSQRSTAASVRNTIFNALSQQSTRVAIITYSVSAIAALTLHIVTAYSFGTSYDPKLTLFVKSRKHPHYLNGRTLFLLGSQVICALAFVLRGAMIDRFVFRWSLPINNTQNQLHLMVLMSLLSSAVISTLSLTTALLAFGLVRLTLPIFFKIPLVGLCLRPFAAHFLRGPWTLSLPIYHFILVCRAWCLSFTTFLTWEIASNLFENVTAERAALSTLTPDPNLTLVSGMTSPDRIFQFFALLELRDLGTDESASAATRRTALFGDQKNVPNLWQCLCKEAFALLEADYQLASRRGQPAPPPPPATPLKKLATFDANIGTPTPLLRQRIFKTTPNSPGQAALDALASDGPLAKALEAGADATHVPELFRSAETRVLRSPVAEEAKKNVESVKTLSSRLSSRAGRLSGGLVGYVPKGVKYEIGKLADWWKRERLSKQVEAALVFREMDVVIVDVLSYLICASLTEDQYGVVQRDIPKILELMVNFLTTIEEYQVEISAKYQPPASTDDLSSAELNELTTLSHELARSLTTLGFVADGLKEAIARIARTFGMRLFAFKFSGRVGAKINGFLEYS